MSRDRVARTELVDGAWHAYWFHSHSRWAEADGRGGSYCLQCAVLVGLESKASQPRREVQNTVSLTASTL
eukprot:2904918-Amphidinium_carterae.1